MTIAIRATMVTAPCLKLLLCFQHCGQPSPREGQQSDGMMRPPTHAPRETLLVCASLGDTQGFFSVFRGYLTKFSGY